ncbi:winged helix-turn-helix transcriptional regulator [Streptomyces sp. NPDC008159]|uniref:winged helix-turn-helix transcriptional regulator n=1 Tax=Streptomyces sp. NPDC008159 TaxID=3364817 RepID=UPI0036EEC183
MTFWPTDADPGHLEQTLARLSPRWTTWTLLTLQRHDHLRLSELGRALPWISGTALSQQMPRLQHHGLVVRTGRGQYQVTDTARQLAPVFKVLSSWESTRFPTDRPTAEAERIETALARLRPRDTTTVLHFLAQHPRASFTELQQRIGRPRSAYARLQRMQADALLARTGHGRYELTETGAALGPVYEALNTWSANRTTAPAPVHIAAPVVQETVSTRATAALRRTTTAVQGLFSHAPTPESAVPAAWTTASRPLHTR